MSRRILAVPYDCALLMFAAPLPRATEPFVVIAAAVVMGVGLSLGQTIWVTLLHQLVPNDKLGRVSSVASLRSARLAAPNPLRIRAPAPRTHEGCDYRRQAR